MRTVEAVEDRPTSASPSARTSPHVGTSPTSGTSRSATASPPELLRLELQRLRDRGFRFRAAWPAAVNHALRGENVHAAAFWRQAFSEQEVWAMSYSQVPWPKKRRPALSPTDDDFSQPAGRTLALAVG